MPPIPLTPTCRAICRDGDELRLQIATDAMEECGNDSLAHVLRSYYHIQRNIRTISPELLKAFEEERKNLNVEYALQHQNSAQTYYTKTMHQAAYSYPIGPFYFNLSCSFAAWLNNPDMLSEEPIRHLTVLGCPINDDLGLFLRNYRTRRLYSLTMFLAYNARDMPRLMLILRENFALMNAHTFSIQFRAWDRNMLIKSAILPKVSKTCAVTINGVKLQ